MESPQATAEDASLAQLLEMGFSLPRAAEALAESGRAAEALAESGGDLMRALNCLAQGSQPPVRPAPPAEAPLTLSAVSRSRPHL
jgi:hypothetical protein